MLKNLLTQSNCKNGPEEFLENGSAGLIFNNNTKNKLSEKLIEFKKLDNSSIFKKKILAKKKLLKIHNVQPLQKN